jgi:hypothetical protein
MSVACRDPCQRVQQECADLVRMRHGKQMTCAIDDDLELALARRQNMVATGGLIELVKDGPAGASPVVALPRERHRRKGG